MDWRIARSLLECRGSSARRLHISTPPRLRRQRPWGAGLRTRHRLLQRTRPHQAHRKDRVRGQGARPNPLARSAGPDIRDGRASTSRSWTIADSCRSPAPSADTRRLRAHGGLLANSSTSVGIMDNMSRLRSRDLFPSEEPVRPPGKLIGRNSDVEELASCFSCENPSVLIAEQQALGQACPPLVCTGGRPSDAVRLLFSSVHRSGAQIRHHGDFDEAGVQILRDLEDRYGAVPWRFDVESLCGALHGLGRAPLHPRPATLEGAVQKLATTLPEELVIDDLISDLRAVGRASARK